MHSGLSFCIIGPRSRLARQFSAFALPCRGLEFLYAENSYRHAGLVQRVAVIFAEKLSPLTNAQGKPVERPTCQPNSPLCASSVQMPEALTCVHHPASAPSFLPVPVPVTHAHGTVVAIHAATRRRHRPVLIV